MYVNATPSAIAIAIVIMYVTFWVTICYCYGFITTDYNFYLNKL